MAELENHLRFEPRRYQAVERETQVTLLREVDSLGIHVRPRLVVSHRIVPTWRG